MKVIALKPILYRVNESMKVADKGEVIELSSEMYEWRKKRGEVQEVNGAESSDEIVVSEGLPTLDEISTSKGKRK